MALTEEQIKALLQPPTTKKTPSKKEELRLKYPLPPQRGPYRECDIPAQCIISGYFGIDDNNERVWKKTHGACRAPAYAKLQGKPCCDRHAILLMNEMLHEQGITS